MLKILKNKNMEGQSLLEAIAAIFVIIVGLVGSLAVAYSSLSSNNEAKTRIVAVNLAREAVEVIHNMRDSNWMASATWDNGLSAPGSDYDGALVLDYANNAWTINFTPNDFSSLLTELYRFKSGAYKDLYVQGFNGAGAAPANTEKTSYKRFVKLNPICSDGTIVTNGATCGTKIGIQILAEVRWEEHNKVHNLTIEDRIYNWK